MLLIVSLLTIAALFAFIMFEESMTGLVLIAIATYVLVFFASENISESVTITKQYVDNMKSPQQIIVTIKKPSKEQVEKFDELKFDNLSKTEILEDIKEISTRTEVEFTDVNIDGNNIHKKEGEVKDVTAESQFDLDNE